MTRVALRPNRSPWWPQTNARGAERGRQRQWWRRTRSAQSRIVLRFRAEEERTEDEACCLRVDDVVVPLDARAYERGCKYLSLFLG